jgi:hypothetical protein
MMLKKVEAKYRMNLMVTRIKDIDEFENFKKVIQRMKESDMEKLNFIYRNLPETKQAFMREVLQSQRVLIDKKAAPVARKIVKVKRK